MKKIFYILAAMLLCLTACQREALVEGNGRSTTVPPAPDALGVVEFTVDYPESGLGTRATMGEANIPSKLYVAVFAEDNGYLQNWIPVEMVQPEVTPTPAGMKVTYKYKAYFPINSNEIFHFIGDPPTESPTFSYEDDFIRSMVTTGKEGAFWQRVKVKGGIVAKRNADGSYDLDDNGNYKIDLNANGYDEETKLNPLRHVVMIRNFAKIDVQSGDPHFDVLQWALVNVPKSGTVAPWSGQTTGDVVGFDVPYTSIKDYLPEYTAQQGGEGKHLLGTFYDDLVLLDASGYHGYYGTVPTIISTLDPRELKAEDLIDQSEPTSFVKPIDTDPGVYMYERPVPDLTSNQPPTRLLAQLEWKSVPQDAPGITVGAKQWYLIDIFDQNGEYMPFLRNIKYKMYLSGIDEGGYATSTEAFNGNVFGNVSTALETSMLNEITVGDSKIVVANLDYPFFNKDPEESTLEFQYYPKKDEDPVFNSSDPETVPETSRNHIYITLKTVPGYDPAILSLSNIKEDIDEGRTPTIVTSLSGVTETITHSDGTWGVIPFTLDKSGNTMKKSIIRVQGSIGNQRGIFREVMYTVMANPEFSTATTVSDLSSDASGQPVTVTIGLPEGLGSSMFPIQVRIEAENGCLSTTATELPVKDAVSTFVSEDGGTQAGKRTFYYIRTIKYSEYYDATRTPQYNYTFPCVFTTTKTSGNAPTRIKLSDEQGRFTSVIKDLKVGSGS